MTDQAQRSWPRWIRHPFRSWTLRRRLVLAVVALVALLGLVIGLVSILFLRTYLTSRLDGQLHEAGNRASTTVTQMLRSTGSVSAEQIVRQVVTSSGQAPGTLGALISDGRIVAVSYLGVSAQGVNASPPSVSSEASRKLADLPQDRRPASVELGGTLGEYRLVSARLPGDLELVVGLPLSDVQETTSQLALIILLVTLGGVFLAAGAGLMIVRLALRPLDRVADTAQAVSMLPLDRGEVALAVRVPEEDTDGRTEVGRVGASLNHMLGHVASALTARQLSENKVRQFVADASHELRTPLASIRGYAELSRRAPGDVPGDVTHAIERIESEAKRMTGLVEDLLLLARLDEGRSLRHDPVDFSRLLIDAISDAHAAGRDHVWSVDLPEEPVQVIGDEPRLYQVITNLLANTRVHTPAGTEVRARLEVANDLVVLSVADNGPGIPEELQPNLFERFARGDSSRSRGTGSTGLGLAIVRAVVDAHGGTVVAESEPGRTVFTVSLPVVAEAPETGSSCAAASDDLE